MKLSLFIKKEYKKVFVKKEWKEHFRTSHFPSTGIKGEERKVWAKKSLDDIQKIFGFESKIWIVTSTFNKKTRLVNIDVYDLNGKYINNFLVKLPVNILIYRINSNEMTLYKTNLYIFEKNSDGDFELVKYKLINVPAWAK